MSEQDLRDRYIGYYAAVTEIDDNIARVLGALEQRKLRENTIIIYTSDHGCAIGHKGFFGKGNSTRPLNMYEISLQVPLILSGAGIESADARPVRRPLRYLSYDLPVGGFGAAR